MIHKTINWFAEIKIRKLIAIEFMKSILTFLIIMIKELSVCRLRNNSLFMAQADELPQVAYTQIYNFRPLLRVFYAVFSKWKKICWMHILRKILKVIFLNFRILFNILLILGLPRDILLFLRLQLSNLFNFDFEGLHLLLLHVLLVLQ